MLMTDLPAGMSVLHRCDNPACVRPEHLFLGTQLENIADRTRKGRSSHHAAKNTGHKGEAHYAAKLTEAGVREIRAAVAGGETGRSVAKRYGVSDVLVSYIVRRKAWSHVA